MVFALWFDKSIAEPRPYWIFPVTQEDIEETYVFNGLAAASGHTDLDFHQPGTPVTLISAALSRGLNAGPADIGRLLFYGRVVALVLLMIGIMTFVFFVLPKDIPIFLGVAIAITPFLQPSVATFVSYWSPWVLVIPAGILAVFSLSRAMRFLTSPQKSNVPTDILLAGVSAGLCLTLVIFFVPFVVASLIGLLSLVTFGLPRRLDPNTTQKQARVASLFALGLFTLALVLSLYLIDHGASPTLRFRLVVASAIAWLIVFVVLYSSSRAIKRVRATALLLVGTIYLAGLSLGWLIGSLWLAPKALYVAIQEALLRLSTPSMSSGGPLSTFFRDVWVYLRQEPAWMALFVFTVVTVGLTTLNLARQRERERERDDFRRIYWCHASIIVGIDIYYDCNGLRPNFRRFFAGVAFMGASALPSPCGNADPTCPRMGCRSNIPSPPA